MLDTSPEVNFQCGRFFISEDEFEFRINSLCSQFIKIRAFAKFAWDNYNKIINGRVVSGDLAMSSDFLSIFLTKEFVDAKGMFRKICREHPFEFLIMVDFCRKMILNILVCCCYKGEFFNLPDNVCFMQRARMKCMCQKEHFLYVLFL